MLQIYRDGKLVSLMEAVGAEDEPYLSVDDVLTRLFALRDAGEIRIEPNADALQRMAVRASIVAALAKDKAEDGIRRYAVDRRGGRINRSSSRLGELLDVHRREAIASIQRFMLLEGPAAYESQAQLLGALDPTADVELVARQASGAVDEAVRRGMKTGRDAVAPNERAV